MKIEPGFAHNLSHLDCPALAASRDSVIIIDHNLRIVGYNEAYVLFTRTHCQFDSNTELLLGSSMLFAIDEPQQHVFHQKFRSAITTHTPFEYDYQCPSLIDHKKLHLSGYPLPRKKGMLITHHLQLSLGQGQTGIEHQHFIPKKNELITQCCHCRKIRAKNSEHPWYWIPQVLENKLSNISHGFCPFCQEHYYPGLL
jgi:hypothetical protein